MAHDRLTALRTAIAIAVLLIGVVPIACSPKTRSTKPPPPRSTRLEVPAEYPTIQAAIDAAIDGDTIRIAHGRYRGVGNTNLDPLGKAIRIRGEGDSDSTIIECRLGDGRSTNGFVISKGEGGNTTIERLTITGSGNGSDGYGSAVSCHHASPSFRYCIIRGNGGRVVDLWASTAYFAVCHIQGNVTSKREPTIRCQESSPSFQGCEISSNRMWDQPAVLCENGHIQFRECRLERNMNYHGFGGAIGLISSTAVVISTTLAKNVCGEASGGAVALADGASIDIRLSTIAENAAGFSGGAIIVDGFTTVYILLSIVWGNCAPEYSNMEALEAATIVIDGSAVDTSRIGGGGQVIYRGKLVTADPMFCRVSGCDPALESDYHLQPGSPCAEEPRMGAFRVGCEEVAPE